MGKKLQGLRMKFLIVTKSWAIELTNGFSKKCFDVAFGCVLDTGLIQIEELCGNKTSGCSNMEVK